MSILKKIQEAISASRELADLKITETPGNLFVVGSMSRAALLAWQIVFDEKPDWLTYHCKDDSGDEIEPLSGQENESYRFTIQFTSSDVSPHLFTTEGWKSFLLNETLLYKAAEVKLAFIENGFITKAFKVDRWIYAPVSSVLLEPNKIVSNSPRKLVRSQSAEFMAPLRIEPWIHITPEIEQSEVITIWKKAAATMIAKSLPNELYKDENIQKVLLAGQPPRRLEFGEVQLNDSLFPKLQEVAAWIYLEGEDVEVKHTFLSSELARAWTSNDAFCIGLNSRLANAIESARLIYKAHLRSGSKDTLKALADLRKALNDDVQKLLQQSKDLSGAIWRDVAIAIGVLAVRFSVDGVKSNNLNTGFALIFALVAAYILVSYLISITTNNKFLKIVNASRSSWRIHLYGFLDENDYQALADIPLQDADTAYRCTEKRAAIIVFSVVLALLVGVLIEMGWIEPIAMALKNFMNCVISHAMKFSEDLRNYLTTP